MPNTQRMYVRPTIMAHVYTFQCPACKYQAEVIGGTDASMLAVFQTCVCSTRQALLDIVTGECNNETDEIDDVPLGSRRCPLCRRKTCLQVWPVRKRPYPKCGSKMERQSDNPVMIWD